MKHSIIHSAFRSLGKSFEKLIEETFSFISRIYIVINYFLLLSLINLSAGHILHDRKREAKRSEMCKMFILVHM
jgi:hypothetical protein